MMKMKRYLSFALSLFLLAANLPLFAIAEYNDSDDCIIAAQEETSLAESLCQSMNVLDESALFSLEESENTDAPDSISESAPENDMIFELPAVQLENAPAAYVLAEEMGMSIEELAAAADMSTAELLSMDEDEIALLRIELLTAQAETSQRTITSGSCGSKLYWNFDNGTLVITGSGTMSNYEYSSDRPWDDLKDKIKSIVISEGVTSIGKCAFEFCDNLKSITIPASISRIGNYAFSWSSNLENVYISDLAAFINIDYVDYSSHPSSYSGKMNLYLNGEPVTDLVVPASIGKIPSYTFYGCKTLKSVSIPSTVYSIGKNAFLNCSNLTEAMVPQCTVKGGFLDGGVWAIFSESFGNLNLQLNVSFASGVTKFGEDAFKGCLLASIRIPDNCTIHKTAFKDALAIEFYVYENSPGHKFCKNNGYNYSLIKIKEIILPEYEILMDAGSCYTVQPTYFPDYARNTIKYSTSNKDIAKVSASGVITAVKAGTATITVKGDSATAKVKVKVKNAPKKVFVETAKNVLAIDETTEVTVRYDGKAYGSYTLASSNPDAVSIDENEVLHAVGIGKSTITATAYNGVSGSIDIWVKQAPTTVLLDHTSTELPVGQTLQITASLPDDETGVISYYSLDESIAMVDASGKIKGISGGQTIIRAEAHNGVYSDCTVTVHELQILVARTSIGLGETLAVSCRRIPESTSPVKYTISAKKIASINSDGDNAVLTALKTGSVKVTAKAENGSSTSVKITVCKKPVSFKLAAERNSIGIGEDLQINAVFNKGTAGSVKYSIVEPAICDFASIDSASGLLTTFGILESGQTLTLRGETYNGKTAEMTIAVTPAPEDISVNAETIDLWQGDSFTLVSTITENTSSRIRYNAIEGSDLIQIDANGTITALADNGTAIVEISTYNGLSVQTYITLHAAPEDIRLEVPFTTLSAGDQLQIHETILPENGSCRRIWSSSNKKIATVSPDGLISALKPGSVTITLKTYNGVKKSVKLTIKEKPSKGVLVLPDAIGLNETILIRAKGNTGGYANIIAAEISADSSGIIDIRDGAVHALQLGTASIRVQLYTGVWTNWKEISVMNAPAAGEMGIAVQHPWGGGWAEAVFADINYRVAKGDYMNLKHVYGDGYAGSYDVYSTNPSIVSISGSKAKFLKEGTVSVVFETYNGETISVRFEVAALPTSLWLDGDSKCTVGFDDSLFIMQSANGEESSLDFDYVHYTISASGSAVKLDKDPEYSGYGALDYTARKTSSSRITVKFFNGKKISKTINVVRNKANGIEPKPRVQDYNDWELCLKSVEIVSDDKIVCEFYIVNPYSLFNITSLNQQEISIYYGNTTIADQYFRKIKVSVPRRSVKLFRLTFSGNGVLDTNFDLRGNKESLWFMRFFAG